MQQKYKIFFRRHVFIFASKDDFEGKADAVRKTLTKDESYEMIERLKGITRPQTILITKPNAYLEFLSFFKVVLAGGGGVFNKKGKLLLIHRLGKWDLPKGKLEKDESPEEGAIREVEEECNVFGLTILQPLQDTYHIYYQKKWCLKHTFWFAMYSSDYKKAKPQLKEQIDQVKWVRPDKTDFQELNTYSSIRAVLNQLQHLEVNID